jgi:hypothetical protein
MQVAALLARELLLLPTPCEGTHVRKLQVHLFHTQRCDVP